MSRKYTAQEMRELADRMFDYTKDAFGLEIYDCRSNSVDCDATHDVICMLRQAADDMERKKKYEYSFRYYLFKPNGERIRCTGKSTFSSFNIKDVKEVCDEHNGRHWTIGRNAEKTVLIRREVGEWEDVPND